MRILKFLFSSFLVLGVLAVIGFFIGREVLLFLGTAKVKTSLTELRSISVNYGTYVNACRTKGSSPDLVAVSGLQLRFLNNQEYVIEVICTGLQYDPIVIGHEKLPPFVTKEVGAGGITWGVELSTVSLRAFGRSQSVGVQNNEIISSVTPLSSGVTPQTTCEGRGFMCCTSDAQFGTGQLQDQVTDCPKSCFASCLARPIILSFTTDPVFESNRTVVLGANESIQFAYVVSYASKKPAKVTLDYGDGQQETLPGLNGQISHVYTCNTGICNYQVSLNVVTQDEINSVVNELSQLTVQVSPR